MKLLHTDFKKGEVKVKIENLDDLWYLSQIVEKNDLVKGRTLRKIKTGEETQRKQKAEKKAVFLLIEVEKVEFSKTSPFSIIIYVALLVLVAVGLRPGMAERIVRAWLTTEFEGGRHARRVRQIARIESMYMASASGRCRTITLSVRSARA